MLTKSTKPIRTRQTVGPNIVRAWFDTVINPLLHALRNEQSCLERGDNTWRFRPGGLEAIRSIRAYLDLEARDNFDQVVRFYPAVKSAANVHDNAVASLSDSCRELQDVLESSPELMGVYKRVTMAKSLAALGYSSLEEVFGAYPVSDHLALLAQYIVNNTVVLPYYDYSARLWNKFREEFLAILEAPAVRAQRLARDRAGQKLGSSVKTLLRLLEETRLELSLEHDVPYVTLTGIAGDLR